ncbi:MAG: succinate dehydrogenase iron-sulfur subunit [Armatimonadetes bacterium]|nr:succinate dehydrogenase iron-sulfur subunit [Armatimonadota bacterium]MBS1711892.1 succinate dehydrogenase iron-sulfur subunit [Armatimonadota bacterium]MBX3109554.1 succinate dehydrogenase iron-sulfur subunit [Fimbriimonadaceae bacterium]
MSAAANATTIRFEIKRQNNANSAPFTHVFEIPYREDANVISTLMEIRKNPVTVDGQAVEPVAWEAACLETVCGTCTMYVNGHIRQACTALIDEVAERVGDKLVVRLEPMRKFPVIRDLIVDRSQMFKNLIKVKAWVPIDGSYDLGMAPPQDDHVRKLRYDISRCMTCGCCMEACPQVNERTEFVGPAAIAQALLFNLHPVGKTFSEDRLEYLTSAEGMTNCGNAQNCVKVCPNEVPLTLAIAEMNRQTTVYKVKKFLGLAG